MRSGFVSLVGRPNVGKSTLLNRILGAKVTIVSDKPQTTRTQVRGVLNRDDTQIVFVDTPGIHKPRTTLGSRLNDTAVSAIGDVDAVALVLDATGMVDTGRRGSIGRGDRFVAELAPSSAVVIINKVDRVTRDQVPLCLTAAFEALGESHEYFPVSAATGTGVDELVVHLASRMPEGPLLYPADVVTDVPEAFWVAELVREQLLAVTHDEVPHSVACVVTEWEWPRIRCEILVERDSQKGIVIGHGGSVLKQVGTNVRQQLPPGAFVELAVRVEKDWQRRPAALNRLGY